MKPLSPSARRTLALVCLGVMLAVGLGLALTARVGRTGGVSGDFPVFYKAAVGLLRGEPLHREAAGGYVYPPLLAFLMTPLTHLGQASAAYAFVGINVALAWLLALLMSMQSSTRLLSATPAERRPPVDLLAVAAVACLGLLLSLDKVRSVVSGGQTDLLVLFGVVLGLVWLPRRPMLSGAAIAFAGSIKYVSLILLPYLILRRKWAAAGWTIAFTAIWSVVPVTISGWSTNAANLGIAWGGLARLLGLPVGDRPVAANQPITLPESVSITSTIARWMLDDHGRLATYGVIGLMALGVLIATWALYRRAGVGLLWRRRDDPREPAMVLIEWCGVLTAVMLFSPQTQGRHMVALLPMHVAIAALLLIARPGVPRWPLLAAVLLMQAGLNLPPGGRRFDAWVDAWRAVGGASWCLVVLWLVFVWTALRFVRVGGRG